MRPQNIENFHFWVKRRPPGATPLTDFEFFQGLLYAYFSVSNFMRFASQVTELLRRNRALVNQAQFFRAPCRKNYTLDRKMNGTLFDGLDELYHLAKFGKDRTRRAGCRCENVVFVTMFFSVCHAPSPEHRAFEGCIVRTSIALPFIARFRRGLQRFLTGDSSFRLTTQFSYSLLGDAAIFTKLRSKIAKSLKIGVKVCAHHFVQIAEVFEKKFHRSSLGPRLQMCTYIKFFVHVATQH